MTKTTALAAALAVTLTGAAQADTFTTGAEIGTAGSIRATVGDLGLTFTGFTVDDDLGNVQSALVGFDGMGFGVAGVFGTGGTDANGNTIVAGDSTIDGIGIDMNELLRLEFDRTVKITSLAFGGVDDFDDFYIAVTDEDGVRISNQGTMLGVFEPLVGRSFDIVAGYPNQNCTTSASQPCGGATDSFQLTGATVAAVPVPAALPLLGLALGAIGVAGRRRRG